MRIFESHAHYDDEKFDSDREEILKKIHSSGVEKIISAGYSLQGSKNGLELAKTHDYIYTTLGISPNDIDENYEQEIEEINKILCDDKTGKIVAIGEIGLDYHYSTEKEKQKSAFTKQIELANKHNLPIVIHTREAVMDTLQILKEHPVAQKGQFHCCPFNRELVKEALKLGFYISFSGTCTFKNAKNAEEIVQMVPDDRFLIETDSPYLAPEPVRGTRNDSRNLRYIIEKIAKFKNREAYEIAEMSYDNAIRLFKI